LGKAGKYRKLLEYRKNRGQYLTDQEDRAESLGNIGKI
jgi:hypothetical protein